MKHLRKQLMVTLAAALLSSAAYAQTAPQPIQSGKQAAILAFGQFKTAVASMDYTACMERYYVWDNAYKKMKITPTGYIDYPYVAGKVGTVLGGGAILYYKTEQDFRRDFNPLYGSFVPEFNKLARPLCASKYVPYVVPKPPVIIPVPTPAPLCLQRARWDVKVEGCARGTCLFKYYAHFTTSDNKREYVDMGRQAVAVDGSIFIEGTDILNLQALRSKASEALNQVILSKNVEGAFRIKKAIGRCSNFETEYNISLPRNG